LPSGKAIDVKYYHGGLPATVRRQNTEVFKGMEGWPVMLTMTNPDGKPGDVGVIENGKLMLPIIAELKKVERKSSTLGASRRWGRRVIHQGRGRGELDGRETDRVERRQVPQHRD